MMRVASNQALHDYLARLAESLQERGAESMAEVIAAAARQAAGLSTEFLGESRIALEQVLNSNQPVLSDAIRAEIADVLKQLDFALDRNR
jgi:hypothetical protein